MTEIDRGIMGKCSEMDKRYFETHPSETEYVRPALFNEFPDTDVNPYIHVVKLSDTMRQRLPVPVNDKRFLYTWGFYTYGKCTILDIVAGLIGIERKELDKAIKSTK